MASPFQMQPQEYFHWCWAAVGASIRNYFFPASAWKQCQMATRVTGDNRCCDVPLPSELDESAHLQDTLDGTDVPYQVLAAVPLPFDNFRTQINNSVPVCARIQGPGQGGGHLVVVYGYGVLNPQEQWVDIADPFWGYWTIPYDYFVHSYQGYGEWSDTFLIQPPAQNGAN